MLRCWRELLMASHRRYTSGNGDALASAVTYSVLIALAPVLLVAATLSTHAPDAVRQAATRTLPAPVSALLDVAAGAPRSLSLLAALMAVWAGTRAIRTARTAFRAVCGQDAGSGNPVLDNLRDLWLAAAVYSALALSVMLVASIPSDLAARVVGMGCLAAMIGLAMWVLPWPTTGRPGPRPIGATAVLAALLIVGLGSLGAEILARTMPGRELVHGVAAGVVASAVWVTLSVRAVLRALSLASVLDGWTAPWTERRALWVVVPAYQEADRIEDTLRALADQEDITFTLVVADNGSTDRTVEVVRRFDAPFPVHVVVEPERGIGCALDAGVRFAASHGAELIARTDADALPRPDWIRHIRRRFGHGAEVVCGASVPRRDEDPTPAERWVLPSVQRVLAVYGRYRRAHRDPGFQAPYVLCHGHNLSFTTEVYERCGGADRRPIEAGSEDVELLNRMRRHTAAVVRAEDVVVECSVRRLRAWGAKRTLLWYWDRRFVPADTEEVHVR